MQCMMACNCFGQIIDLALAWDKFAGFGHIPILQRQQTGIEDGRPQRIFGYDDGRESLLCRHAAAQWLDVCRTQCGNRLPKSGNALVVAVIVGQSGMGNARLAQLRSPLRVGAEHKALDERIGRVRQWALQVYYHRICLPECWLYVGKKPFNAVPVNLPAHTTIEQDIAREKQCE